MGQDARRIYEEIIKYGWSDNVEAFTQAYGRDALDASNLIMPMVFFMSPSDPRMLKTLDAIQRSPANGGLVYSNLVYRYNLHETQDGLTGEEGHIQHVHLLARRSVNPRRTLRPFAAGRGAFNVRTHARLRQPTSDSTPKRFGPKGEHLGNFPQAFTHLALISAAFNLDRALGSQSLIRHHFQTVIFHLRIRPVPRRFVDPTCRRIFRINI